MGACCGKENDSKGKPKVRWDGGNGARPIGGYPTDDNAGDGANVAKAGENGKAQAHPPAHQNRANHGHSN